jgi:NAD(P)-dependent dehydrogenase (short-subunit alcohol dehydrogenase family)
VSDSSSDPLTASDRVAIVTGANTGIGKVTARELAATGRRVILACRNEAKARVAIDEIVAATGNDKVEFLQLDLSSLSSVRASAAGFLARDLPLHLLVNNAGLVSSKRGVTEDGFEMTFGVNHLGHFLFTTLLLDTLRESEPARIVHIASKAHFRCREIDWDALTQPSGTTSGFAEYTVSKLANVLFNAELGRRLEGSGVTTYAVHPGVVATDIWRRVWRPFRWVVKLFMIDEEEGARTTLHCALSEAAGVENGLYYTDSKALSPSSMGRDAELAAELWRRSEGWVASP